VIDLHLHTTASDGTCTPEELVHRAQRVGLRTISVTDHDTMAGVAPAAAAAGDIGMEVVPGIEITSVHNGRDVHILAYFLADTAPGLRELLAEQRRARVERAGEIARRLAAAGAPIDLQALLDSGGNAPRSLARPAIARALVAAGHATSVADAFDRYLGETQAAYVPHTGASPETVVRLVVDAGGLASLAHPGQLGRDDLIPALVDAGLHAVEAYHSSHPAETVAHYLSIADRHGLLVTGGSDYHGEGTRRSEFFGVTTLPPDRFASLLEVAACR
jgi:predicted metal-dependent phosphoesterase TrpH